MSAPKGTTSPLWKLFRYLIYLRLSSLKCKLKFLNSFLVLSVKINFSWNSISGNLLYHIKLLVIIWAKHITNFLYLCITNKSHKFSWTTMNFQNKFFGSINYCFDNITQIKKSKNHFVVVFFSSLWEVFN